jgi:hypothetical protein
MKKLVTYAKAMVKVIICSLLCCFVNFHFFIFSFFHFFIFSFFHFNLTVLRTPKHRCPHCHGNRVVSDSKILTVEVAPGIPSNGHRILFPNIGSESPYKIASDVEVIINVQSHPMYTRKGSSIYVNAYLSIIECLVGFNRTYITPDNHTIRLNRNNVMSPPGTEFEFQNYGLPIFISKSDRDKRKRKKMKERKRKEKEKNKKIMIHNKSSSKNTKHEHSTYNVNGGEEEEPTKKGSFVVVVHLKKNSLYEMTNEQRQLLRSVLKSKVNERYQQNKKNDHGTSKRRGKREEKERATKENFRNTKLADDGNSSSGSNGERDEDDELIDHSKNIYIVHLKQINTLFNGMGTFFMPLNNITNRSSNYTKKK